MTTRNRIGTQAVDTVATTTSNSTTDPSKDKRTPSNPSTLKAVPALEFVSSVYTAMVTLTWVIPTTATDGTKMTVDHTETWMLKGTGTGVFARNTAVDVPDNNVDLHGFAPGSTWQFKVRAMGQNGKVSAFSNTVSVPMPTDAPSPPKPSLPIVSSAHAMVSIGWDGFATGGVHMPDDFNNIKIQRSTNASFTPQSSIVDVTEISAAGSAVDGPFQVGLTFYYRFIAINRLGVLGDPTSPGQPVKIAGTPGGDIVPGSIDPTKFSDKLNQQIEAAITATEGGTIPGNRIFGPQSSMPVGTVDDPLRPGDLWYDSGNNNTPWRFNGTDSGPPNHGWVNVRDSIIADAFQQVVNEGVVLGAPYLLPDYVKTKLIEATLVSADKIVAGDIIATGTISSASGLFGEVDAGVLTTGYLDANRIAARTITADLMVVADMTNLADESEFDHGAKAWTDPKAPAPEGGGTNAPKAVADHPVLAADGTTQLGDGHVYSLRGDGTGYTVRNSRTVPAVETDQFYGEMWVRKTAAATTGKISLELLVGLTGHPPTTSVAPICSYTFKAADPVNKWIRITGMLVPFPVTVKPPVTKPPNPLPWVPNTKVLDPGAVSATTRISVDSTVSNGGEIQVASVMVRRKNNANLIVDGSITASNIAAGSITSLEIKSGTISAGNIAVDTITAGEIATRTLTADLMDVGMLTGAMLQGDVLRTNKVDYSDPKKPIYSYPSIEISTAGGIQYLVKSAAGVVDWLFQMNPGASPPVLQWRTSTDKKASRVEIDFHGIRLYPNGLTTTGPPSVNLQADTGSLVLTGSADVAHTITGATIQTGTADPRIVMDSTQFRMTNSAKPPSSQILFKPGTKAEGGVVLLDTGPDHYPRFVLNTGGATPGLIWYGSSSSDVNFKLDGGSGQVTVQGGIISQGTITGALVQTAATGARVFMSSTAFQMSDANAHILFRLMPSIPGVIHLDTVTYPRLLLDTNPDTGGFRWYDEKKKQTFELDFNTGDITMDGAIVTTGTITGAVISTGLKSTGAHITLDPTNGIRAYKNSTTTTFSVDMAGNADFTGDIHSGSTLTTVKIYTTDLYTTTINGSTTFAGGSQSGANLTQPAISSPNLGGVTDNSGAIITGGTVRTSGGSRRVQMVSDQVQFFWNNVMVGVIEGYAVGGSSGDILMMGSGSTGTVDIGFGSQGEVLSVSNNGKGVIYAPGIRDSHIPAVTNYDAVYVDRTSGYMGVYTSSVRYKKAVRPLDLDPAFMGIETASWSDKPNRASIASRIATPGAPRRATGFTAENLHRVGATDMVSYDRQRRPFSIQQPAILAHTVRYTQWLVAQVEELTARVVALEGAS